MFKLLALEMLHWDFWQRMTLPLEAQIVTITGPNGSGKTTLLDALRTLLGLACSGRRDYKRYVRRNATGMAWLRAVVDNPRNASGRHPFFPLLSPQVTLACRIRRQGGDWIRQYVIQEGDVSIESLDASATWLGVQDYRRRLESAGLTQVMAEVLSLEQGDTDKLCEYSPRALLNLVFQVFGEKEVMDNYTYAKTEQREAQKELEGLQISLNQLGVRVEEMTLKVNRYLEWQRLQQESDDLSQYILPWLKTEELLSQQRDMLQRYRHSRRQLAQARRSVQHEENAHRALHQQMQAAQEAEQTQEAAVSQAQQALQARRMEASRIEHVLREEERLKALAAAEAPEDSETLLAQMQSLRQEQNDIQQRLRVNKTRRQELAQLQFVLQGGKQPAPEFVNRFRSALDGAGIAHQTLPEIVEVLNPEWQGAVEALLAPYRHVVLLNQANQRLQAWALGEQMKYRHFIVADRQRPATPVPGSVLEVVRFHADVPDWLSQLLNQVQRVQTIAEGGRLGSQQSWITVDGFHKERRGGRHIGVDAQDHCFGEGARQARLHAVDDELQQLQQLLQQDERRLQPIAEALASCSARIQGFDALNMLAARQDEFSQAHQSWEAAQHAVHEAAQALLQIMEGHKRAVAHRHQLDIEQHGYHSQREALLRQVTEALRQASEARQKLVEAVHKRRSLSPALPEDLVQRARLLQQAEAYQSPGEAQRELHRLQEKLNAEYWESDPQTLSLRDKLKHDWDEQQREMQRREQQYERARSLTDDARAAYIQVLRNTVRGYGRNLKRLGELAGVDVHVIPPHLENDDVVLAQAGLNIEFNFDQKGRMGLNDGEASGGQQVMKSLILLIGLMMDDDRPGGFVFIDEPFAHLDLVNIDRVAAFLCATQAQYLITSPNTHNVNVFAPSELTFITRKKTPSAAWAPPILMVAREVQTLPSKKAPGIKSS